MIGQAGGISFVRLPGLTGAGAVHAFLGRTGGVSEGPFASLNLGFRTDDRPEAVAENDRRVRRAFGIEHLVRVRQVHGHAALVADLAHADRVPEVEADILLSNRPGLALAVLTADCVPIALYDPEHRAAAMVHAGWRGTCLGAVSAAVEAMAARYGSRPEQLWAGIGPAVGPCCYRVDAPVVRAIEEQFGREAATLLRPAENNESWLDLTAANRLALHRAGLPPAQVESADLCTACRADLFFSHRRDRGQSGRQLSFILAAD